MIADHGVRLAASHTSGQEWAGVAQDLWRQTISQERASCSARVHRAGALHIGVESLAGWSGACSAYLLHSAIGPSGVRFPGRLRRILRRLGRLPLPSTCPAGFAALGRLTGRWSEAPGWLLLRA